MTGVTDLTAGAGARQRCIEPGCATGYNLDERIYTCARCGGLLAIEYDEARHTADELRDVWTRRRVSFDHADRSGVWRYRELLPFADDAPIVTLDEGGTPLYDAPRAAVYAGLRALKLKHQGCNPTGSFKDTGMTVAVTQAARLGARTVVCASTGNTAASLAAYAARASLRCAIIVPAIGVSSAKLAQSLDYGAIVLQLEGNFDDAMRVVRELAEDDSIYLVNSINPFRIEGQKTVAAEIAHQLGWRVPDHVVVPGGNLGNSTALGKGFAELLALGVIDRLPKLSVVQAEGAAPFAQMFGRDAGAWAAVEHIPIDALTPVADPRTLATAIKIGAPVSWRKALRAVADSGGGVLSVTEQEVADAKAIIGRDGVGCEPASATTIAGIKRLVRDGRIDAGEEVVAVLTGHVLKDTDYAIDYHRGALRTHGAGEDHDTKDHDTAEQTIHSTFANAPVQVKADTRAVLDRLARIGDARDAVLRR